MLRENPTFLVTIFFSNRERPGETSDTARYHAPSYHQRAASFVWETTYLTEPKPVSSQVLIETYPDIANRSLAR